MIAPGVPGLFGAIFKRRLYFLFPEARQAYAAAQELLQTGVDAAHMHAIARSPVPAGVLPWATRRQRQDLMRTLEGWLWLASLALFGLAMIALVAVLRQGVTLWLLLPLAVLVIAFGTGLAIARAPAVHLDEFRSALAHGEVLLMVDVPARRVPEIEDLLARRHPEAAIGGVGWMIDAFGL